LVGAFFLSLLVFAAVIVIVAVAVVYVLWSSRKYDAYRARAANDERIIDGEVLETDSHDPPRS
jgi:CHASE3 domain sensor protein